MPRQIYIALLLVAAPACTSTLPSRAPGSAPMELEKAQADSAKAGPLRQERRHPNRITLEEIRSSSLLNAYELVQALRPRWLRLRGITETEVVSVEINGMPAGGVEILRRLSLSEIMGLEFSDAFDATQRRAGDARHRGTINVTTGP